MARFALPHVLAGLTHRIGHDDPVRNARAELDLAERRIDEADDVIRRVEAAAQARSEPTDPEVRTRPSTSTPTRHGSTSGSPRARRPRTVRAA